MLLLSRSLQFIEELKKVSRSWVLKDGEDYSREVSP